MMIETGVVVAQQEGQVVVVRCEKSSACEHCPSVDNCNSGHERGSREVRVFDPLGAKVGAQVRIQTSSRNFLQSSFILYMVPVFGLLLGAGIGELLSTRVDLGIDPHLLSALLGVAFLVGTFLTIRIGSRAINPANYMPQLIEIINPPTDVKD